MSSKVIIRINESGREFVQKMDTAEFTFGRGLDATVRTNDASVSRTNTKVEFADNELWVTDLGSTNGTFINGKQIKANTRIQIIVSDVLSLGRWKGEVRFEISSAAVESEVRALPEAAALAASQSLSQPLARTGSDSPPGQRATENSSVSINLPSETKANALLGNVALKPSHLQVVSEPVIAAGVASIPSESYEIVDNAKKEARKIQSQAQTQADEALAEAKRKSRDILLNAEREALDKVADIYKKSRLLQEQAERTLSEATSEAKNRPPN